MKITDETWVELEPLAKDHGVDVRRCKHGTLVTEDPVKLGVLLGWVQGRVDGGTLLSETLDVEIVTRTRSQETRRAVVSALVRMHPIIASRGIKLEALDGMELRDLLLVVRGIQGKLSDAQRKARRPWC